MLHLLLWSASGLVAGSFVRVITRSSRDFGVAGDLVTGWLGALVGGWLFRRLGFVAPDNVIAHVVVGVTGAALLIGLLRAGAGWPQSASSEPATNGESSGTDPERLPTRLGGFERRLLQAIVARQHTARDPNEAFDARATFGDRLADGVARFGGSWTFIGLFGVILVGWMAYNEGTSRPFDPFPFILLNLLLSCVAALQAPVIMMSQNRQSAKDRSDARADYEVNVRAEVEVMALHAKLDLVREQDWTRVIALLERQQRALEQLEERLAERGRPDA
jgi:uncharacterized membrane protein/uncharacterized membrane protein YeaQ/YmgE (transglycosylase-associated protein family)